MLGRPGKDKTTPEAEELKALIAAARQEGASLVALTQKLGDHDARVKTLTAGLTRLETVITEAGAKVEAMESRFGRVETVAKSMLELENLAQVLATTVKDAKQTADRLVAPDGDLQKQRLAAQQLSALALQTRATLDGLKIDQDRLDKLRADLGPTLEQLQKARDQAASTASEVTAVRVEMTELAKEQTRIRETSRESRDDAAAAAAKVTEVDQKLAGLNRLQDLARTLDERISALNATVEHVMQRSKVLEQQKHTVERAIIESHRLGGMVTAMEGQVVRLDEGRRQAAAAEDTLERVEQLARESAQQLDEAGRRRDTLAGDLDRLDRDRSTLMEFVAKHEERLGSERREMEAAEARAAALGAAIEKVERAQDAVNARGKELEALVQRIDGLDQQLAITTERAEDAGRKIEIVEVLKQDLMRVDEMARRATWQMESLKAARTDLEELRTDVQTFYREHAEAIQLRDKLSADRVALEGFLDRASAFAVTLPEVDARLSAVRAKLAAVEEGTQKAANLVAIADDLDRQMTRLTGYQQFVERIEARLNALQTLTTDVDRKIDDQIARRGEVDTLRSLCDGVSMQVSEIRQKLGGVSQIQEKLLPVAAQVTQLRQEVETAEARLESALRDETEIADQERRIAEMLKAARELAGAAEGRMSQAQTLTEALARSESIKDGLMKELSVVQGRQREVAGQLDAADALGKQLDATLKQLEERRHQLAFAEKRMSAFEAGVTTLKGAAADVDGRIQDLTKRQEVLDALRKEVQGVRELSAQSKADLDHVEAHRADILGLRAQVDELLAAARTTEERLAEINTRRRMVDEVQLKVTVITSMLDDVRLSLETVGTQRAVIDHALRDLARLDGVIQQADRTLKSLQNERELAEHIERSIQSLRLRTAISEDKKRA